MSRLPHSELQRRIAAMRPPWAGWFEGKEFTTDWATAHAGIWSQVLAPLRHTALHVLEIGSFEGRSAIFWLEYLPGSHVTCIDQFIGTTRHNHDIETRFDRNVAAYGARVRKISDVSSRALAMLGGEQACFDLIYVDGSHRRDDVMIDCLMSWPLLRPGGIMILDDYLLDPHKPSAERPGEAIETFLRWHSDEQEELSRGYQIILRRRAGDASVQAT